MFREQNFQQAFVNKIKPPLSLLLLALAIGTLTAYSPKISIAIAVLTVGTIVVVLISARWAELFLLLAVGTNFMKSAYLPGLAVGEFGATPFMLFLFLATVGFSIQLVSSKRQLIWPPGALFFLFFVAFSTLSLLLAQNYRLAFGAYVRNALEWILFFLLIQMLINRVKVSKLIRVLYLQAFIVTGWGVFSGIYLEVINSSRRSLFFWQQFQKNDFAAYLGVVLILALTIFSLSKSRLSKLFSLLLLLMVPIGWIFTFSRGGLIAIATCLIVFLILERNKHLLRQFFIGITLVGLFGFAFISFSSTEAEQLAIDGIRSIFTGQSEAERHTHTIEFRIELIKAAIEVLKDKPIVGVGFNQWQFYSPITTRVFDPQTGQIRDMGNSVHNRYLLIAVNSGVLTLINYLGILVTTLLYGLRWRHSADRQMRIYIHAFIAAVLGMQIALQFAPFVLWEWPTLGILIGMANVVKIEKGSRSAEK